MTESDGATHPMSRPQSVICWSLTGVWGTNAGEPECGRHLIAFNTASAAVKADRRASERAGLQSSAVHLTTYTRFTSRITAWKANICSINTTIAQLRAQSDGRISHPVACSYRAAAAQLNRMIGCHCAYDHSDASDRFKPRTWGNDVHQGCMH